MPASSFAAVPMGLVSRPRMVVSRTLEKTPLKHGEKSYQDMVVSAFRGPTLRLTERMRLLEEADKRKIRRGDAIDLIEAVQQIADAKFQIEPQSLKRKVATRFFGFAAAYAVFALAWCMIVAAH